MFTRERIQVRLVSFKRRHQPGIGLQSTSSILHGQIVRKKSRWALLVNYEHRAARIQVSADMRGGQREYITYVTKKAAAKLDRSERWRDNAAWGRPLACRAAGARSPLMLNTIFNKIINILNTNSKSYLVLKGGLKTPKEIWCCQLERCLPVRGGRSEYITYIPKQCDRKPWWNAAGARWPLMLPAPTLPPCDARMRGCPSEHISHISGGKQR